MAYCHECSTEIDEARFCPECGAPQAKQPEQKPIGPTCVAPPKAPMPAPSTEKGRRPQIGFAGMVLLVLSALVCLASGGEPNTLVIIGVLAGVGLLVYALFTGNIKLLG